MEKGDNLCHRMENQWGQFLSQNGKGGQFVSQNGTGEQFLSQNAKGWQLPQNGKEEWFLSENGTGEQFLSQNGKREMFCHRVEKEQNVLLLRIKEGLFCHRTEQKQRTVLSQGKRLDKKFMRKWAGHSTQHGTIFFFFKLIDNNDGKICAL